MPYSNKTYSADGSVDSFPITFDYINQADVKVYVNDVQQTSGFTFPSKHVLQFATNPTGLVSLQRVTPRDAPLVDFQDATVLTEADLDTANKQVLFIAQESLDAGTNALATPLGESGLVIPRSAERKGKLLGFDSVSGYAVTYDPSLLPATAVTSFIAPLLQTTSSASACAAIGAARVAGETFTGDINTPDLTATENSSKVGNSKFVQAVVAAAVAAAVDALTTSYLAAGRFLDAGWASPPAGLRVLRCNGQAPSLTAYPGLINIYCGDANNDTASWGYRCTDPANPGTTRSTTGGYIVLPKTNGRFRRDLTDNSGVGNGQTLWMYGTDDLKSHSHTYYASENSTDGTAPDVERLAGFRATGYQTSATGGTETTPYFYVCTTWITY